MEIPKLGSWVTAGVTERERERDEGAVGCGQHAPHTGLVEIGEEVKTFQRRLSLDSAVFLDSLMFLVPQFCRLGYDNSRYALNIGIREESPRTNENYYLNRSSIVRN